MSWFFDASMFIVIFLWQLIGPDQAKSTYEDLSSTLLSKDVPPGKLGRPVILNQKLRGSVQVLVTNGWDEHGFNKYVSDIIPLNRSLLDPRDPWCLGKGRFLEELPQASVVICFHNEALSTLLRTIHSVINRSPPHLLKEIILIDDCSFTNDLGWKLKNHISAFSKVKLLRATKCGGLVGGRIDGAKAATAPVIVFLDSHCECSEGWLIPLLDRIARDYTNVASPVVDHIDDDTFQYVPQNSFDLQIGGFTWNLNYIWRNIPTKELLSRKSLSSPVKTPIISGGLFAINKRFLQQLGYYDDGFKLWGGDNFDISFKVWMCGGTLEVIPCSHVGHVFRKSFPYRAPVERQLRNNLARIAEVWLDDAAKYFYQRTGKAKGDAGDISVQKALRSKCKSFDWYLKNIYPQLEIPDHNIAGGQVTNMADTSKCLDAQTRQFSITERVELLPCHYEGGNQYWDYTTNGQLKSDNFCLDVISDKAVLSPCWDLSVPLRLWMDRNQKLARGSQIWIHDSKTKLIKHLVTQKCLVAELLRNEIVLNLSHCQRNVINQQWIMEHYNPSNVPMEMKRTMMFIST